MYKGLIYLHQTEKRMDYFLELLKIEGSNTISIWLSQYLEFLYHQ